MALAPCPVHGSTYRALHEHSFRGIIDVIDEIITTISGVGTVSYAKCPIGYTHNFEGIVRALEDLNLTASGIQTSPISEGSILPGSGITFTPSGDAHIIAVNSLGMGGVGVTYSGGIGAQFIVISGADNITNAVISGVVAGPGITVTPSGSSAIVSTNISGQGSVDVSYNAGIGLISGQENANVVGGSGISVYASGVSKVIDVGVLGGADIGTSYSGAFVTVESTGGGRATLSGSPGTGYKAGSLWFDTNEGRLFVYASGNGITKPDWYITNAEALAIKSEVPPSGTGGKNAPPRDGSIWFNTLMGNLFIYDASSSGWYESAPARTPSYSAIAPTNAVDGSLWTRSTDANLTVWNGSNWQDVVASGNDPGQSEGEVIGLIMGLS